jgi:hypothetical protein
MWRYHGWMPTHATHTGNAFRPTHRQCTPNHFQHPAPTAEWQSSSGSSGGGGGSAETVPKALGVDYGRKKVGLAVSTMGFAPRPLPALMRSGQETIAEVAQSVVQVAQKEGVCGPEGGKGKERAWKRDTCM